MEVDIPFPVGSRWSASLRASSKEFSLVGHLADGNSDDQVVKGVPPKIRKLPGFGPLFFETKPKLLL